MTDDDLPKDWWTQDPKLVRQARDLARIHIANKTISRAWDDVTRNVQRALDAFNKGHRRKATK
jgi:hypothetical protein